MSTLTTSAGTDLGRQLRGQLIRPGDADYDDARAVWNGMIDRRPALIARCAAVADVVAAVNFAREHNLALAVRGGGHNVAGHATVDDGLVIDLSPMNQIEVDPDSAARHARQGGATWGEVDPPPSSTAWPPPAARLRHRHRRPDPGRRLRLAAQQVRPDLRQPARRRGRHRRRPRPHRQRAKQPRSVLGAARAAAATSASSPPSPIRCTLSAQKIDFLAVFLPGETLATPCASTATSPAPHRTRSACSPFAVWSPTMRTPSRKRRAARPS